ncbi:MAG: methionine--tRNA ligase subunit beta [Patescibacteria group bacterium]|mgnify:CR=1 FL=1
MTNPIIPISPVINFADFAKVDLRVGQVISAERVEGSDKLLKLMIDEGLENKRQIIAGLGKSYEAGELVGEQVVFVANLEPRKLMGLESAGMILAVGAPEAKVIKPAVAVANGLRLS